MAGKPGTPRVVRERLLMAAQETVNPRFYAYCERLLHVWVAF
jgi:hypothetical protein